MSGGFLVMTGVTLCYSQRALRPAAVRGPSHTLPSAAGCLTVPRLVTFVYHREFHRIGDCELYQAGADALPKRRDRPRPKDPPSRQPPDAHRDYPVCCRAGSATGRGRYGHAPVAQACSIDPRDAPTRQGLTGRPQHRPHRGGQYGLCLDPSLELVVQPPAAVAPRSLFFARRP